jgi:hypothetical protein
MNGKTLTEEQLRKLIDLRNKKIIAQEQYKNYCDEITEVVSSVITTDPLQFEIDGKEYEFIYSSYYQCIIFRAKQRKGGNCYGTAVKNKSNFKRPTYPKNYERN